MGPNMLLTINPQIVTQMMTQDSTVYLTQIVTQMMTQDFTAYLTQVVRYWILVDSNLAGFERDQPNSTSKLEHQGLTPCTKSNLLVNIAKARTTQPSIVAIIAT